MPEVYKESRTEEGLGAIELPLCASERAQAAFLGGFAQSVASGRKQVRCGPAWCVHMLFPALCLACQDLMAEL